MIAYSHSIGWLTGTLGTVIYNSIFMISYGPIIYCIIISTSEAILVNYIDIGSETQLIIVIIDITCSAVTRQKVRRVGRKKSIMPGIDELIITMHQLFLLDFDNELMILLRDSNNAILYNYCFSAATTAKRVEHVTAGTVNVLL